MIGKKYVPDSAANASLSAVTTGTGKAVAVNDCRQVEWFVTYVSGSAPTTGTVLIEHALTVDYAGVWNQLDSIDCSALSAGTAGFGTFPGPIGFMRARITDNTDQAITAYINGLLG